MSDQDQEENVKQNYLMRHKSWSFVSFKQKRNHEGECRQTSTTKDKQTDPDAQTRRHHSLLDMSVVSGQAFLSLDGAEDMEHGGQRRGGEEDRQRDRMVWSKDTGTEEMGRRRTTNEIINQLEEEISFKSKR
jgi:hypothetical protein